MRERLPSHPLIDKRDLPAPGMVAGSELEFVLREMQELEERLNRRIDEALKRESAPVRLQGPGYSYTGNWKAIVSLMTVIAVVICFYLYLRYRNPEAFPKTKIGWLCNAPTRML